MPIETFVYSKVEGVDRNLVITDHIKSFPREGNLIFQEKIKKDKDKTSSSDLLNRYVIVSQKGFNKEIKLGRVLENGDAMSIKELKEIAKQHGLNNRTKNSNKSLPDLKPDGRGISNNDLKTNNRSNSSGGNSGGGNSGGGNSGGGNSGGGNSGGGNSSGGKTKK